jgi:hypothetical protein
MSTRLRHTVRQCGELRHLRERQADQADAALAAANERVADADKLKTEAAQHVEAIESAWREQVSGARINLQMAQVLSHASLLAENRLHQRQAASERAKSEQADALERKLAALAHHHAARALLKKHKRRLSAADEERRQSEIEDRTTRKMGGTP